jgi:hypothetical protein
MGWQTYGEPTAVRDRKLDWERTDSGRGMVVPERATEGQEAGRQ